MTHRLVLSFVVACLTCGAFTTAAVDDAGARQRSAQAVQLLEQFLRTPVEGRKPLAEQSFAATPLDKPEAEAAQRLLWKDHVASIRRERAAEMKERKVVDGKLVMPFAYTVFGEKPARGRSLFISMHGG